MPMLRMTKKMRDSVECRVNKVVSISFKGKELEVQERPARSCFG